jgi:type IV secretory pathway VirB4 component
VGRDLAGGPFFHDPFQLYAAGVLTNPNMTVIGQIGRGKSALVKSYLYRQSAFGRRIAVLDPKGEYAELARALGAEPIKLSPAGGTRVNPLDSFSASGDGRAIAAVRRQRLTLLGALAEATMKRRLEPVERLAVELALDHCTERAAEGRHRRSGDGAGGCWAGPPTLAEVVEALLAPPQAAARAGGLSREGLAAEGRSAGLELRRLVLGDLAGMFDGRTTATAAGGSGVLVLDLSEAYHSDALSALMVCAAAWLQAMTAAPTDEAAPKTLFVVDEAWAVLSDVAVARFLRSSFKLARARGLANIAVCHRASDLTAAGAAGSEAVQLAEGLLADSETVVCYAQPASEITALSSLLGCSEKELEYLPRLGRGLALWRVGDRRFLVENLLSKRERSLVDTDARLLDSPARYG